ncbi:type II toxin-antitoxin system death-on-curing family toxin [Humisphaera borealis]|uniref:Type II toxin-antitoxin system death-on-curing family toxin n=1 Tax=Humisphaera borealis TaxID=2807512 RepID=A0A7M2WV59_9BACT|nr:type II toxin-antitoxin system death-on-curing family toxin [Humisphaera borealis]QOV88721.1 type II toxin-antitoxin system death-on-curing family toxin [Humisphaera borealis]
MAEPRFLTADEVLELHEDQIDRYGGSAGVRDFGLLESALAMPQQTAFGHRLHDDVPAMAAAYLYHLVRNHAFVDGNKRIGALACDQFLFLNDLDLTLTEEQLVQCVLAVATGKMSKEELTLLIRQHVRPLS